MNNDTETTKLNNGNLAQNEIVDNEDTQLVPEGGGKHIEDPTCWEKTTGLIKGTIVVIYKSLNWIFNGVKSVCGCIFYPIKEQCLRCYRRFDLYMNPYRDTTVNRF